MKKQFRIIDALEINFVDSCALDKLKLDTSREREGKQKGVGEKRLYIGKTKDRSEFDEFFEFKNVKYFFFKKVDLLKYLQDAKDEYLHPTQEYFNNISLFYEENLKLINDLEEDYLEFNFKSSYDKQDRYYLVLEGNRSKNNLNRVNYYYILSICLPRVSKFNFVKIESDGKKIIYLKPHFVIKNKIEDLIVEQKETKADRDKIRKAQTKYRFSLLDAMPFCIVSEVADDRILTACHIKPYAKCDEKERYDGANGVVLTPTYHYLFDIGFISFEDNGNLMVSDFLSKRNQAKLHIKTGQKTKIKITQERKRYLKYHRENIFQRVLVE